MKHWSPWWIHPTHLGSWPIGELICIFITGWRMQMPMPYLNAIVIAALPTEAQTMGREECLRVGWQAACKCHLVFGTCQNVGRERESWQLWSLNLWWRTEFYFILKTMRVVLPSSLQEPLFNSLHSGKFGGHLRESKMHSEISRQYLWPKMRTDIAKFCKNCLVCATRRPGRAVKPPIPVTGAFDWVGVDVIKFQVSQSKPLCCSFHRLLDKVAWSVCGRRLDCIDHRQSSGDWDHTTSWCPIGGTLWSRQCLPFLYDVRSLLITGS